MTTLDNYDYRLEAALQLIRASAMEDVRGYANYRILADCLQEVLNDNVCD